MMIRTAKPDDAPGIAAVRVETWRATYRGILPDRYLDGLRAEAKVEPLREGILSPEEHFFVAEDDGWIVGFIILGPERDGLKPHAGEVYAIYVLPEYQRRGIGRRLMAAATNRLIELGFTSLLLWTPESNLYCSFYEQLGGTRVGHKEYDIGGTLVDLTAYGWEKLPS